MFVGKGDPIFGIHIEVFPNYSDRIMDTHYPSQFNWKVQKEQSYAPVSISHRSGQDQASEREQAARAARREGGGSGDPGDMRGAERGGGGGQPADWSSYGGAS